MKNTNKWHLRGKPGVSVAIVSLLLTLMSPIPSFAQGMMGSSGSPQVVTQPVNFSSGHTASEEAEGKEIWEKLQAKTLECNNLTDDNYGSLGEYFMGQMMGSSHESMNTMMAQMMGEKGEKQMHIIMGRRLSGCDTSATIPSQGAGFMPMMGMMSIVNMMGGGWGNQLGRGGGWSMMGGWGVFGLITWILVIIFLILGIIYFWKEINRR